MHHVASSYMMRSICSNLCGQKWYKYKSVEQLHALKPVSKVTTYGPPTPPPIPTHGWTWTSGKVIQVKLKTLFAALCQIMNKSVFSTHGGTTPDLE